MTDRLGEAPSEREWLEGIGERFEREHEERMTDRLGEALADMEFALEHLGGVFNEDLHVLDGVDPQAEDMLEDSAEVVVAAARSWHALTNPTDELIEQVARIMHDNDPAYAPPYWSDCTEGMRAFYRGGAKSVLDALTDTAEEGT